MTVRIFYQDAMAQSVEANVIATGIDEKGHYAVLDRSCFYPEGGGQPADKGVIGKTQVTDVQTVDGEIRHYTTSALAQGEYSAAIDWERRFDHMQQHTGQHLLSAVFEDGFGMATKSFHLGTDRVSIDLDVPSISAEQLKQVEQQANQLIASHIPIETEWVTQEQASGLSLRKKPAVEGEIRLVKIADTDINACGGTHLTNTAQLGVIKIVRVEKAKSATRVYFLCGNRALNHFNLLQSVADQLIRSFNVPAAELPEAAAALLSDRQDKEKKLKKLTLQLLESEAESLRPEGDALIRDFSGRPIKEVQRLAKLTAENHGLLYLLFIVQEHSQLRFICAKGKNSGGNMKQVLEKLIEGSGGNVGGTEDLAQGSAPVGRNPEMYTAAFQNLIKEIT
ncbi:alanyl-tRNA editing protein [Planococcus salinarum]|uniref:alanyl-tRNA editing protein n=1 Tax=Planococcus salinarum TaxID=622695 RepID=UPI00163D4C68|nr:alanyl-tRNA editing protein [Planococcus salinarum]